MCRKGEKGRKAGNSSSEDIAVGSLEVESPGSVAAAGCLPIFWLVNPTDSVEANAPVVWSSPSIVEKKGRLRSEGVSRFHQ